MATLPWASFAADLATKAANAHVLLTPKHRKPVKNLKSKDKTLPASLGELLLLAKRGLFELPSGRLSESAKPMMIIRHHRIKQAIQQNFIMVKRQQSREQIQPAKPIAASRTKLALI